MATWAKPKIYYDSIPGAAGSTITATSAETANPVDNIHSTLETNKWKAANTTDPHVIDVDLGSGLLTNGDFETGAVSPWSSTFQGGAAGSFAASATSPYQGTYKGLVTITSGGTGPADIQIAQKPVPVINGKSYTVIFAVKAAAARTIKAQLTLGGSPWTPYGYDLTKSLTTSWQVFRDTFTATATDDIARFFWSLGGDTNDVDLDIAGVYRGEPAADYLIIMGHNLATVGASVVLQHSDDDVTYTDAFTTDKVLSDGIYIKEFTKTAAKRYWRLSITGHTAAPEISICRWGLKTELDYATASFDPYGQTARATVNVTQGGYVSGIHEKHIERDIALRFADADAALYTKVKDWWDGSGMANFFVAWETANNPADVYLMRPDPRFNNPLTNGGLYRDITLNLKGRKA